MQSTTNYQLVKQELTDKADITQISGNWDKIDTEMKRLSDEKFDKTGGTISGAVTISAGGIAVTGGADIAGGIDSDSLALTGNATVGGTLGATGKVTASGGVEVTGGTKTDTLTVTNGATLGGAITLSGKLNANGGLEVKGGQTVTGNAVFNDSIVSKINFLGVVDATKGTAPASQKSWHLGVYDKNGFGIPSNRLARIQYTLLTDGTAQMAYYVNKPTEGASEDPVGIIAQWLNGTTARISVTHHPSNNSNDKSLATTYWVRNLKATASQFGLVKLADETALLSEADDATLTVDKAYALNDFRRMNTAYAVGDKVNCAFKFEYFLECTQAGTTSGTTLDTRNVTFGQEITDGTVQWTVRTHIRSVNGAFPSATGDIPQSALGCLPLTGGTMTGSIVVKRHVLNTESGASIYTAESDSELQICAGSNNYTEAGGVLTLYSQSAAGDIKQGGFTLAARKGDDLAELKGAPDGTLFWNEKDVMRAYTPTSTQTDLGNIASETVLTAPDDGWMVLSVTTNNSGITEVRISNETTGLNGYQLTGQTNNRWVTVTVPVSKGDQVRIYYGGANFSECKFIYARGAV